MLTFGVNSSILCINDREVTMKVKELKKLLENYSDEVEVGWIDAFGVLIPLKAEKVQYLGKNYDVRDKDGKQLNVEILELPEQCDCAFYNSESKFQ